MLVILDTGHSFFKAVVIYFFEEFDLRLSSYFALIFLGVVVFIVQKIYLKTFSFIGVLKYMGRKLLSLVLVCLAVVLQKIIPMEMSFREITLLFLVINQSLEILKYADKIVPVPKKVTEALEKLQQTNEKDNSENVKRDE